MGFNPLKWPAAIAGLVLKLLGVARKLNLAGKAYDFMLKAEALRGMKGEQKFAYVLNKLTADPTVKKWLEGLKAKAIKLGMNGDALYNGGYDGLKQMIEAIVTAANSLGILLPHADPAKLAASPYKATVKTADLNRLGGSIG